MENGNWKMEVGNGNWKSENGNWIMEVGKWKSETRSGMAPIGHGKDLDDIVFAIWTHVLT